MSMRIVPKHLFMDPREWCVEFKPLKTVADVIVKNIDPEYVKKARVRGAAGAKRNTSKYYSTIAKNRHEREKGGKY